MASPYYDQEERDWLASLSPAERQAAMQARQPFWDRLSTAPEMWSEATRGGHSALANLRGSLNPQRKEWFVGGSPSGQPASPPMDYESAKIARDIGQRDASANLEEERAVRSTAQEP